MGRLVESPPNCVIDGPRHSLGCGLSDHRPVRPLPQTTKKPRPGTPAKSPARYTIHRSHLLAASRQKAGRAATRFRLLLSSQMLLSAYVAGIHTVPLKRRRDNNKTQCEEECQCPRQRPCSLTMPETQTPTAVLSLICPHAGTPTRSDTKLSCNVFAKSKNKNPLGLVADPPPSEIPHHSLNAA